MLLKNHHRKQETAREGGRVWQVFRELVAKAASFGRSLPKLAALATAFGRSPEDLPHPSSAECPASFTRLPAQRFRPAVHGGLVGSWLLGARFTGLRGVWLEPFEM